MPIIQAGYFSEELLQYTNKFSRGSLSQMSEKYAKSYKTLKKGINIVSTLVRSEVSQWEKRVVSQSFPCFRQVNMLCLPCTKKYTPDVT